MDKKMFTVLFVLAGLFLSSRPVLACGHDGFFLGVGYQQMFMYTTEHQYRSVSGVSSPKITFGPGFGANFLVGYDFDGTRWGIQLPLEYSYIKLNKLRHVHYFGTSLEGILHLASWSNGLDVSLVGGPGLSVLPYDTTDSSERAVGVNAGIGPGLNYFFARAGTIKGSLYIQAPIRMIYFFGNNLSNNHTLVFSVPIRLGLSMGF